jgi:hypothetical protein
MTFSVAGQFACGQPSSNRERDGVPTRGKSRVTRISPFCYLHLAQDDIQDLSRYLRGKGEIKALLTEKTGSSSGLRKS